MDYEVVFVLISYFIVLIGGLTHFIKKSFLGTRKDYYNLICPKDGRNNVSGNKADSCVVCSLKFYPDQN